MTEGQAWLCALCYRRWVTGLSPGLETAPECHHEAEVHLPHWFDDEAEALRWLAAEAKKLEAGRRPAQKGQAQP